MVDTIKYLTGRSFSNIPLKDRLEIWADLTEYERNCVIDSCQTHREKDIIEYTIREAGRRVSK